VPARGHIAYDPNGRIFALADGEELLVHDGESEGPLWREEHGEALVGVAIAGDDLVAVGEDGLVRRHTFLHREISRAAIGPGVTAFDVRADGTLAAAHPHHLSLLRRNDLAPVPIPHAGATALAWSRDGARLLVATSDAKAHALRLLDGARGEPVGEPTPIERPALALAACPDGTFLVAAGDRVLRFERPGAAPAHVTRAKDQKITDVAVSADGARFAIQIERSTVAVLGFPPSETLLSVEYPQRVCAGVVFGPRPWIGIALAGGDANKCNVETLAVHRSDTHPGRTHNSWLLMKGGVGLARARARDTSPPVDAAPAPAPKESAEEALARGAAARERALAQQRALEQAERELSASRGMSADDTRLALRVGLIAIGLLLALARACMHSP
jgi:hypothetical protein